MSHQSRVFGLEPIIYHCFFAVLCAPASLHDISSIFLSRSYYIQQKLPKPFLPQRRGDAEKSIPRGYLLITRLNGVHRPRFFQASRSLCVFNFLLIPTRRSYFVDLFDENSRLSPSLGIFELFLSCLLTFDSRLLTDDC